MQFRVTNTSLLIQEYFFIQYSIPVHLPYSVTCNSRLIFSSVKLCVNIGMYITWMATSLACSSDCPCQKADTTTGEQFLCQFNQVIILTCHFLKYIAIFFYHVWLIVQDLSAVGIVQIILSAFLHFLVWCGCRLCLGLKYSAGSLYHNNYKRVVC
jgi:hypothetical protein